MHGVWDPISFGSQIIFWSRRTSNINNETGEDMEGESQKTSSGSEVYCKIFAFILPFRIITINNMTMILSINKQPSDGD